jgi:DNA-binding FadR family transcriptional regulator
VREATKALAFLGIIRAAPRRGLSVGELDWDRASEYLGFHFAISNYPPGMLVSARVVIEIGALPYTMEALSDDPELYGELMAQVDRMVEACDDVDRFIEGDIAFHRALVKSSGIEPLVAFTDFLHTFFKSFRENVRVADRRLGNEVHRKLITALRERDLARAQEMLRQHIEPHARSVRRSPGRREAGDVE